MAPILNSVPTIEISSLPKPLFGMDAAELLDLIESIGQQRFRAAQLVEALYHGRIASLDDITTLPLHLRQTLAEAGYIIGLPEIVQTAVSIDGTERYLVRMADGETVETVWMPEGDGGERGDTTPEDLATEQETAAGQGSAAAQAMNDLYRRATICVSSQVGCAVNCQFCSTAKLGIRRNLTSGEIAGQVAAVLNRHSFEVGRDRLNLVFMGMGEPFLNFQNFMAAVCLLAGPMGIPEMRMTVSTSGILPGILDFARETVRPKLAVSLNASNDLVRQSIMPITRKWNIAALLGAIAKVPLRPRERVTFEYVLLRGVNDSQDHAAELKALLRNLRAKVNLIVWNAGPDMPFQEPSPAAVAAFQSSLRDGGLPAYIRRPRGRDIYAACGQLKRTVETAPISGTLVAQITPAVPA